MERRVLGLRMDWLDKCSGIPVFQFVSLNSQLISVGSVGRWGRKLMCHKPSLFVQISTPRANDVDEKNVRMLGVVERVYGSWKD
jgi:hypothetical protein